MYHQYPMCPGYPANPANPYYGMPESFMDMYQDNSGLTEMYPEVYRRIHPRVIEVCIKYDAYCDPRMYPRVEPRVLEEMVDNVYRMEATQPYAQQYTTGGLFRSLISILLIRELLGRRRRRGFGYYF